MGKVKRLFVCSECERPSGQWAGRCPSCGGWGTITEHPVALGRSGPPRATSPVLSLAPDAEERRIPTGFPGVDRVLGGGLVPGSVILLAGAPGIGKSTLLLQLASALSGAGHPCLLASGEEARGQVAGRAARLGLDGASLRYVPGRDVGEVLAHAELERPAVLVIDSIHTIRDPDSQSLPGGVGQVRGCADRLVALAKEHGIAVILIGHVTKEGDLAGPRALEHAVDTVLSFEGDPGTGLRTLTAGKNRYGPEGEVAWFEMTPTGMRETEPGPRIGQGDGEPGCATALALAGRRGVAVDVQALVVQTGGPPRRQVAGLDPRRFQIVAAVADRSLDLGLSRCEVFGASAGGLRLEDPGADLAVAAAVASAGRGVALPEALGFVGEVSLTGSVRPVAGIDRRLAAAAAAGLEVVMVPAGAAIPPGARRGLRLASVGHVRDVLRPRRREEVGAAARSGL